MYEVILGSVIGTVVSIIIAHIYYRKATTDLIVLKNDIRSELEELKEIVNFVGEDTRDIKESVEREDIFKQGYPFK